MQTVELIPASLWVCDDCGRDNFVRHRVVEPESIEGTEFAAEIGEENRDLTEALGFTVGGAVLVAPTEVTCGHCGSRFAVAFED